MKSFLLARLSLDQSHISNTIHKIKTMEFDDAYQEYSLGIWKTKTLWNMTGNDNQSISMEYIGHAKKTPSGEKLPYLNELIENNFHVQHIKSVRIFHSSNGGLIVPHRDYMEFKKGFKRFHLVLATDKTCLNSEENTVYHMQQGEFWFLEGRVTHSAASISTNGKYSLVIDFDPHIENFSLFKPNNQFQFNDLSPMIIEHREKPSASLLASLMSLSEMITPFNFSNVFHLLCKLHFEYAISGDEVYGLLRDIAKNSTIPKVLELYKQVERCFLTHGPEQLERKSA